MYRIILRLWILGCMLLAGSCMFEPGPKASPVIDENALPSRPDTSGLRNRTRNTAPGQPPQKSADSLLPEIALESRL